MAATAKRILDFHTADEVISEIEELRSGRYSRLKNWNLSQICEHLTATMSGGMNGFGFRLPWVLRATIIKWIFNRMLKTRKMSSGPTLKRLLPKSDNDAHNDADNDATIDECIATIRNADAFEGPMKDYPFLNELSVDDWQQFMWMHAGHHLGFLIPEEAKDSND